MRRSTIAKVMTIMLVVAIVLSITTIVKANSVSMSLSSSSELKAGNTVEVNINLTNVDAGEGINGIAGKLSYDSSIFEAVGSDDLSSNTNWSITYNPDQNKLALIKNSKVNSSETVVTVRMKVKDSANVGSSTTVAFTNISASGGSAQSGGTGDIDVNQASVSIKSVGADITNPTNDEAGSTVPSTLKVSSSDSTKASKNIPQTGDNYTIITVIALVVLVAGVSTVRYTMLRSKLK